MEAAERIDLEHPEAAASALEAEDRPSFTLIVGGKLFRQQLADTLPGLYPRALGLCRNPDNAYDLLNETAERALRFESHFTPGSNLRAWLSQILYSVFVTRCRKRRRERRALEGLRDDPCAWFYQDSAPVLQSLSPSLQAALDTLPSGFADALLLVDVAGLAYKDAASVLEVPVGTIMSRLHRARKMLRDLLLDAGFEWESAA